MENVDFKQINAGAHLGKHAIPREFDTSEHESQKLGFNLDDEGYTEEPMYTSLCLRRSPVDGQICNLPHNHSGDHSFARVGNTEQPTGFVSGRTRAARETDAYETTFHTGISTHPQRTNVLGMGHAFGISQETVFNINTEASGNIDVPKQYKDAMASILSERWKAATDKEIKTLNENGTWEWCEETKIPRGRKPIKSRWVFTVKYLRNGTVDKFKARFVVCGYSQRHGVDYDRAFSATLRATSFRLLLALAASDKHKLYHIDVRNAFTEAEIDRDIWAHGPEGYTPMGKDGKPQLIKLRRALYGAKQSGRLWQEKLNNTLKQLGFVQSKSDPCLHFKSGTHGTIRLGCYVDDLIFSCANTRTRDWFVKEFQKVFSTTPCVDLSWFLGIAIDQHPDHSVSINQERYITDTADKFLPNWRTLNITHRVPYAGDPTKFTKMEGAKTPEERSEMSRHPYLQLIGSLLWIGVMSRPDISYYLSVLCKHMSNPSMETLAAAQHLLLYVASTADKTIKYTHGYVRPTWISDGKLQTYDGPENLGLHAYADSSWGDAEPRYGYTIYLANGPIAYSSKSLKSADSSCEAEYAAANMCAREVYFQRGCLEDLDKDINGPILQLTDNTSAIDVVHNLGATANTKHYKRAIHWIRTEQQDNRIMLKHCDTEDMDADIFTKPLPPKRFTEISTIFFGKAATKRGS